MPRWEKDVRRTIYTLMIGFIGITFPDFVVPSRAGVPSLNDSARRARRAALERRAKEWMRDRARVIVPCPHCRGVGEVRMRGGRTPGRQKTCPSCKGGKRRVDGKMFLRVYYSSYSPDFQSQPGILDELNAVWRHQGTGYVSNASYRGVDAIRDKYKLVDARLADATHGVTRAWVDKARRNPRAPEETRWVWRSEKPGRPGKWFVYCQNVDGTWPARGDLEPYSGARSQGTKALDALLNNWGAASDYVGQHLHRKKDEAVLTIARHSGRYTAIGRGKEGIELRTDTPRVFLDLFSRIFRSSRKWKRATIVEVGHWRNELGEVDRRIRATFHVDRMRFERLRPDALSDSEIMSVLGRRAHAHTNWIQVPPSPYFAATELSDKEALAARAQWPENVPLRPRDAYVRNKRVILTVGVNPSVDVGQAREALSSFALARMQRLLKVLPDAQGASIFVESMWRNDLGETSVKLSHSLNATREVIERVVPKNLDADELLDALGYRRIPHEGWIPWVEASSETDKKGDPQAKPKPSTEKEGVSSG